MTGVSRRAVLALALAGICRVARAEPGRALREMSIHKVPELGLEIWIENQPAWDLERVAVNGRPQWAASSPDYYHPPAAIVYASWPDTRVDDTAFPLVAETAIRRGSENFGLNKHRARQIRVKPAHYGVLDGFEGDFEGRAQGLAMDVKIFVGRQSGRFPVVLTVYTLKGKLTLLSEVIRRGFSRLRYLPPAQVKLGADFPALAWTS